MHNMLGSAQHERLAKLQRYALTNSECWGDGQASHYANRRARCYKKKYTKHFYGNGVGDAKRVLGIFHAK